MLCKSLVQLEQIFLCCVFLLNQINTEKQIIAVVKKIWGGKKYSVVIKVHMQAGFLGWVVCFVMMPVLRSDQTDCYFRVA